MACVRGPRICLVDELTDDRRRAANGLQTDVGVDFRGRENESAFSLQTFSCYLLDATDGDSYFLQFPSKEKKMVTSHFIAPIRLILHNAGGVEWGIG